MALPKAKTERENNESVLAEYEVVGLLEKEWKNIVFGGLILILGIWFYSEYTETINQKNGEISSQFSSSSSDLSSLIDESLKNAPSKELLEKEDRVLKNLSNLANLNDSSYSSFASVLKTAFLVFQGKEVSPEDSSNLEKKLAEYKKSKESLVLYEIISLQKCRILLESGQIEKGISETKALLNESKVIFPEIASVLMLFTPEANKEESKAFIVERLKAAPALEEQTKTALSEIGYSL